MQKDYNSLLWSILENELPEHTFKKLQKVALSKQAFENPLTNSHWSNLIDGALKGLEFVAIASLDWKLTAIVKLLQSWINDKREEKAQKERSEQWGANSYLVDNTQNYSSGGGFGSTYY
jgi:hypothetical protein